MRRMIALLFAGIAVACSSSDTTPQAAAGGSGGTQQDASSGGTAGSAGNGGSAGAQAGSGNGGAGGSLAGGAAGTSNGGSGGASTGGAAGSANGGSAGTSTGGSAGGPPTASQLLALVQSCKQLSNGMYKTDDESSSPANIPICELKGAVFWTADMDIDCDGKQSAVCNLQTDPAYQPETSATDSKNDYLDASKLKFVVIPLPSSRFDYAANGIEYGQVVAVIYNGKLEYGVFGDEGPDNILGESSYAMASALGIDPDPSTGGTDGPVTYIVFTGSTGVAVPIEDQATTDQIGAARAAQLIQDN